MKKEKKQRRNILESIRFRLELYHSQYLNRKKLKAKDFTIISNNCWGGIIYQKYGLKYLSPTCGLLILGNDYIKFCKNLDYYINEELKFFPIENSKYASEYKAMGFPVAMCGDIEIYFMHYPTAEEAAEKWYRRCKRINKDFIIYKLSEREAFSKEDMVAFANLPLENKIIIGEEKYTEDAIVIDGIHTYNGSEEDIVAEIFDEAKYINSIAQKNKKG